MAELAGLLIGAVSLGLQTCSGISGYIDAVKCRGEEIVSVRQKNEALRQILAALNDLVVNSSAQHGSLKMVSEISKCVQYCEKALLALEKMAAELVGCNTSTSDWKHRVKHQAKRLSYAFDRPKLQQLEQRLDQTSSVLQLALQTLGL